MERKSNKNNTLFPEIGQAKIWRPQQRKNYDDKSKTLADTKAYYKASMNKTKWYRAIKTPMD